MSGLGAIATGLVDGYVDGREDRLDRERQKAEDVARPGEGGYRGTPPFNPMGVTRDGGDLSFGNLIDKHEGGGDYDALYGFANRQEGSPFAGVQVSQMTLADLYKFTDPSGAYGQHVKANLPPGSYAAQNGLTSTPLGRYQIVGSTLRSTAQQLGLPEDTVFSPEVQDRMFQHLASQRIERGRRTGDPLGELRAEWEGFKHVPDDVLGAAYQNYVSQGGAGVPRRPLGVRA